MHPRSFLRGLLGLLACVGTTTAVAYEEALTVYTSGRLDAAFSITQIDPFEPKQRWGSFPLLSYGDVLNRTAFIYRYYRSVLGFSEEEIENLQAMDSSANPSMFAYITSRQARSEKLRGVLRIASTGPLPTYFGKLFGGHFHTLLPMEQKYDGVGAYNETHYPKRLEIGRFASDERRPLRRLETLTRLLRAMTLFLFDEMREYALVIESPEMNRHLYEQYGFRVDPAAPMPEGRLLMHVTVRELSELLLARIERARYLPDSLSNIYSHEAGRIGLEQLDQVKLPRLFRRQLGALNYYRAYTLATSGRGKEALPIIETLRAQYGDEPELESLELHVRSLAHVDVWTGIGNPEDLRAWLESPETVNYFRPHDFDRYTCWDDRRYWLAMTALVSGDAQRARDLRNQLALTNYADAPRGALIINTIGRTQIDTVEREHAQNDDRLWHARHLYQATPIGLSPSFNRFCAQLLTNAGEHETAAKMISRAEILEHE